MRPPHSCGNGRREDIAVVDVHKLVPEDAAQLALVENCEDTLSAAHGRVVRVGGPSRTRLGVMVGATQMRGIGWPARSASSRTIA